MKSRRTKEYKIWSYMITRCYNKNATMYKHYGGKGIKTSESWRIFKNFKNDMGSVPNGHTLERIDTSKDYSKENCIWATWHTQRRNKSDNKLIEYGGYRFCETDWCYALGFKKGGSLQRRLNRGWSLEKSLSTSSSGKYVPVSNTIEIIKSNIKYGLYFCRKDKKFKTYKEQGVVRNET